MLIKGIYIFFAYLCGSIPSAYIVAKVFGKADIRVIGSGNPGTTNVLRSVGKIAGILTFAVDVSKGFGPVYFALIIDSSFYYSIVVAFAAIIGHMFTIFLKFNGGKGVATGLGVFLALMPLPSIVAFIIFSLVFVVSGYAALGSVCAAVGLPLVSFFSGYGADHVVFSFAVSVFIIYKHKANIRRLKEGSENRFKIFKRK
ncbi:MAG: glycerol-3-phosphate 1-O-acyltransferase PlsY [Endomicrobium sp.]|nr:glycerol-3-phosphate 1-O-acyltransferase PlsY [Endomicrobium sp.]